MLFTALLLGIIEGLTEFIPVSSTGHLILFGDLLGFQGPPGKVFEIVIQLGAILAILWLYRGKLFQITTGLAKREKAAWHFSMGILLAFLPAMALGALLHDFIKNVLFSVYNVSLALLIGGVAMLLIERYKPSPRLHGFDHIPLPVCFRIGLCQCLAMIPGVSRSGATILGAMLLGVERRAATEFSFFLAIPTMLAATAYDVFKNWDTLSADGAVLIAVGFASAFATALIVVRALVFYVTRHGFAPFACYRIALGGIMLIILNK